MMRTTLDLPDSLLRELKSQAAMKGQSLKDLLHEMILRGLRQPAVDVISKPAAPPILQRLQTRKPAVPGKTQPFISNAKLAELELQDDLGKLRRSGSIK